MTEVELLQEAQKAEAMANSVENPRERQRWEVIAKEWRRLAKAAAEMRQSKLPKGFLDS